MSAFHAYLIAGIVLIALELATSTFYLLLIGVAFILASMIALRFAGWAIPTFTAGMLSIIACILVKSYRNKINKRGRMLVSHIGQEVEVVEILTNRLRVSYSGSYWDATVKHKPIAEVKVGDRLKIIHFTNNNLEVD